VKHVAYALREHFGVGKHSSGTDVVLSICNGSVFLPNFFYAVLAADGIFSSASTGFTPAEIARQIEDGGARVLVCSADCLHSTLAAAKVAGISEERVVVLDNPRRGQFRLLQANSGHDVLGDYKGCSLDWKRISDPSVLASQTIALLYSSGTTGLPKGVRIAHRGLVASLLVTMRAARLGRSSRSLMNPRTDIKL
jgi:acyl-coenzyme A synthetase/AMP-(fatty) acid ligase